MHMLTELCMVYLLLIVLNTDEVLYVGQKGVTVSLQKQRAQCVETIKKLALGVNGSKQGRQVHNLIHS